MSENKTYLQNELMEKVPQKIITHMLRTSIDKDEKVLAVFGGVSFAGISSCALSTEDRIIYLNSASLVMKTTVVFYSDLAAVSTVQEGKYTFIQLSLSDGKSIKLDIKAPADESLKMCRFIENYKDTGAEYIKNRILTDTTYPKIIDAIKSGKSIKIAEIEINSDQRKAEIEINSDQRKAEVEINSDQRKAEIEINSDQQKNAIHQKYQDKIYKAVSKRSYSDYKLICCGGLGGNQKETMTKISVNGPHQTLYLEPVGSSAISIPLSAIRGANVTTDVEIPKEDEKNEYKYYLHIKYEQNGQNGEFTFYHIQKQYCTINHIEQLNYEMNHIDEKIKMAKERDERYDQREQQLLEQRAEFLSKRNAQVDNMHSLLNQDSTVNNDVSQQTAATTVTTSIADELRQLKSLLDDGIITQEEFDTKKKQLLHL